MNVGQQINENKQTRYSNVACAKKEFVELHEKIDLGITAYEETSA